MIGITEDPAGRYRLVRVLGRGGEATVWLAEDRVLGRHVAMKIFPAWPEEGAANCRREVAVLGRLDHPGICRLHDAGVIDGSPFLAMSYVDGRTLASLGVPPAAEAVTLAARVAEIVQAAHAAGVVHGDLSPRNVIATPEGRCVVLDFGVARLLDGAGTERKGGTLPYLAPECLARAPDERSDVFALGALLFELLTGRTPFVAPTRAALIESLLRDEPPLLRSVDSRLSRDIEAVLARALQRDPERRYASMRDLAADLAALTRGEPPRARRVGPFERATRWARHRPSTAALVVFVAGFLSITLGVAAAKNRDLKKYRAGAAAEAGTAVEAAANALESLLRKERLADRRRLQDLEERSRLLVPPRPGIRADLLGWLDDARALVTRLEEHRRALAEVRSRGIRQGPDVVGEDVPGQVRREIDALRARAARLEARQSAEGRPAERERLAAAAARVRKIVAWIEASVPKRERWVYATQGEAWHEAALADLAADLERFADPDRSRGRVADVAARVAEASLVGRTLEGTREAWERARRSIADSHECPAYRGLVVRPQEGLVPLRRNPDSGLWEFHHVLSGAPPRPGSEEGMDPAGGIVLVLIPGGIATVGARRPAPGEAADAPHVDPLAAPEEAPVDKVPLDPFFISKFEMTREQWARVRGAALDVNVHGIPEVLSDWFETKAALERWGLELPTEAQWEHAARGGTTTPWWTGSDPESISRCEVIAAPSPSSVGGRCGNGFGLQDVAGNVSEWCRDVFARYDDPRVPGTGERAGLDEVDHRIRRGGYWKAPASAARSAQRFIESPFARRVDTGVRPARRLDP